MQATFAGSQEAGLRSGVSNEPLTPSPLDELPVLPRQDVVIDYSSIQRPDGSDVLEDIKVRFLNWCRLSMLPYSCQFASYTASLKPCVELFYLKNLGVERDHTERSSAQSQILCSAVLNQSVVNIAGKFQ